MWHFEDAPTVRYRFVKGVELRELACSSLPELTPDQSRKLEDFLSSRLFSEVEKLGVTFAVSWNIKLTLVSTRQFSRGAICLV